MFDRVVRPSDDEARRRSAASFALTSALCAAAVGGFLLGSLLFQVAAPPQETVEAPMVMIEPGGGGKPPPPALPPDVPRRPDRATPEPDPDALPTATPPTEPPPDGGGGTSDDIGPVIGPGRTVGPPGTGPAPTLVPAVRNFAHAKLVIRRKTELDYPESARALGLGEQRCLATVYIDEEGVPYEVDVAGCPLAFHDATETSLLQWRWYPPKDGRSRVKAQTAVGITYRLNP